MRCQSSLQKPYLQDPMQDGRPGVEFSIRLAGSSSYLQGRVEVYVDGVWGTVCDDNWDLSDAMVVCRQLGYGNALFAYSRADRYFGRGSGRIKYDNVNCRGDESMLHLCPLSTDVHCGYFDVAGVVCSSPSASPTLSCCRSCTPENACEVCHTWGEDEWDVVSALLNSRSPSVDSAVSNSPGSSQRKRSTKKKSGTPKSLTRDTLSGPLAPSKNTQHAGAAPSGPPVPMCTSDSNRPSYPPTRDTLSGPLASGTPGAGNRATPVGPLAPTPGKKKSKKSDHAAGSGAMPSRPLASGAPERDNRVAPSGPLVSNSGKASGYRSDPDGNRIARDSPEPERYGFEGHRHTIGFSAEGHKDQPTEPECRGEGEMPKLPTVVSSNDESAISLPLSPSDQRLRVLMKDMVRVLNISPADEPTPDEKGHRSYKKPNSSIRLVGGVDAFQGRVEVYVDGAWGTVCDNEWDINDASVVCRQLGYTGAMSATGSASFGVRSVRIALDYVRCTGLESRLQDCESKISTNGCINDEDAGVVCAMEFPIRLAGSSSSLQGRVEVYVDGVWGTVCNDNWDLSDAMVVCRQLGYGNALFAVSQANIHYGRGSGRIKYDDVNCRGDESMLNLCPLSTDVRCGSFDVAGVVCSSPGASPTLSSNSSIRLVGGVDAFQGRVEVYVDGAWGTVCDNEWDINDASVVCRQLGYTGAMSATGSGSFGVRSVRIALDYVRCTGRESRLQDCESKISTNDCINDEDAGVVCAMEFPIRLVDGSSHLEGRVEVYVDGSWGTVCDDLWDLSDATVVCRQLGYGNALYARSSAYFGQGSGRIKYDDVNCRGDESMLHLCPLSTNKYCRHTEDAGVVCSAPRPTLSYTTVIRLVGGTSIHEGRVEVLLNGDWGTVCDDGWGLNDAKVVCRQLDFTGALSAHSLAHFGQGTVPIAMSEVRCTGSESRLTDCSFQTSHNCDHHEDAGVICIETGFAIRLVGGSSETQGRVEVYLNGVWGTVCDDGWDLDDARVVCRQLGYSNAVQAVGSAHFGQGSGDIFFDDVACRGSETSLLDCVRSTENDCGHFDDAGVICGTPGKEAGFAIRLVGGSSETQGRVEVYVNGIWGTVCDDGWDLDDARVVCRQLGYGEAVRAVGSAHFGRGSGDIFFDDLACTGSETSLLDCTKSTVNINCGHGEDAGVICGTSGSDSSTIRLADGDSALEGRVEVYVGGVWGTVCDGYWDLADATVVCRQLGYGEALTAPGEAFYGPGTGSIVFDEVNCRGTEDNIQDCSYSTVDNCHHSEDASVSCSNSSAAYEFGQVRLVEGNSEYDGYVEIYYKQQWGTICNNQWDKTDADVVCKELGHEFANSTSDASDYKTGRSSTKPIWLVDVACGVYDTRLVNCDHGQWDSIDYCSHGEDVWVKCNGAPVYQPSGPTAGLSSGAIIGIVFGVIVGCILLYVCCKLCCCKSKKGPAKSTTAAPSRTYIQVQQAEVIWRSRGPLPSSAVPQLSDV
ncbi:deleted in malignant brain tumors 1 protein-like [Patiria miniata]|uniref:SRCR domain-containing protein n=1 Tax=Patiria miniata TaxID=46514 RepID=A0A914B1Q9_PATMI|nr:deleted in malignant brain tumors 1 protein-like [Patiria miniata]